MIGRFNHMVLRAEVITQCLYTYTKCSFSVMDKVPNKIYQTALAIIDFLVTFALKRPAIFSIILAVHINRRQETVLMPKRSLILGIQLIRKHTLAF